MTKLAALPQTEAQFQQAVIALARVNGWLVGHHHDSRRQAGKRLVGDRDAAGLPDLWMVRDGYLVIAELKTATGRVSAEQRAWLEALYEVTYRAHEAAGFVGLPAVRAFVWRPEDWPGIARALGDGRRTA